MNKGKRLSPPPDCCDLLSRPYDFCMGAWAFIRFKKELTVRQSEVARLLLAGKSEYQIARALGVETATIRDHLRALTKKLDGAEGHGGILNALWIEHTNWRAGPFPAILPPDDCPLNGGCPPEYPQNCGYPRA